VITADNIILELIATARQATPDEVEAITAHAAQAPFATYLSHVPTRVREGLIQHGVSCPARAPSIEWHLLERVCLDQQWPPGTTATQYVHDLHQAVVHPEAEVWTYRYFDQPYAGFISPSHVQGLPGSERYLFVAYSPVFGTLITGYQTSDRRKVFDVNCKALVRHR
jgi:hypothetical protein